MNKNMLLPMGVGLLVLIVLGVMWRMQTAPRGGTLMLDENSSSSGVRSLNELLAVARPQQCTFSDTVDATASTQGTMYIADGKMRGDYTSVSRGQSTQAHVVANQQEAMVWLEGSTTGYRLALSAATANAGPAALDPNKKINFDCGAWQPDERVFVPPTNVTFTDVRAVLQGSVAPAFQAPSLAPGSPDACAACEAAIEPTRSQCRAALSC